jgi:hypothetical protein
MQSPKWFRAMSVLTAGQKSSKMSALRGNFAQEKQSVLANMARELVDHSQAIASYPLTGLKSETFNLFDQTTDTHAGAGKLRIHVFRNTLETCFTPGTGYFLSENELLAIEQAVCKLEAHGTKKFYIGLVIAARNAGDAAFGASEELDISSTASMEEQIQGHYDADHSFIVIANLRPANPIFSGDWCAKFRVDLRKFIMKVQGEWLSNPDRAKDYQLVFISYSQEAQTLTIHSHIQAYGKIEKGRQGLL